MIIPIGDLVPLIAHSQINFDSNLIVIVKDQLHPIMLMIHKLVMLNRVLLQIIYGRLKYYQVNRKYYQVNASHLITLLIVEYNVNMRNRIF